MASSRLGPLLLTFDPGVPPILYRTNDNTPRVKCTQKHFHGKITNCQKKIFYSQNIIFHRNTNRQWIHQAANNTCAQGFTNFSFEPFETVLGVSETVGVLVVMVMMPNSCSLRIAGFLKRESFEKQCVHILSTFSQAASVGRGNLHEICTNSDAALCTKHQIHGRFNKLKVKVIGGKLKTKFATKGNQFFTDFGELPWE